MSKKKTTVSHPTNPTSNRALTRDWSGWAWLALAVVALAFILNLALHLVSLNATRRAVPTPVVGQRQQSVATTATTATSTSVPVISSMSDASATATKSIATTGPIAVATTTTTTTAPAITLQIVLGQMHQSHVQGEYGVLVDGVQAAVADTPTPQTTGGGSSSSSGGQVTANPNPLPRHLAVRMSVMNFQGSYYQQRSIAGSSAIVLASTLTLDGQPFYYRLVMPQGKGGAPISLTRQLNNGGDGGGTLLDLNNKKPMSFGEKASGWLLFELVASPAQAQDRAKGDTSFVATPPPDYDRRFVAGGAGVVITPPLPAPGLELRFLPPNASIPLRVALKLA